MTVLIVLAAGRGKRLGHLTERVPKCLSVYHGTTLIETILDTVTKSKIQFDEIILISGYRAEKLKYLGLPMIYNPYWEHSGPVRSLICAEKYLKEQTTIVTYSDIIYSANFLIDSDSFPADIFVPNNVNFLEHWPCRNKEILDDLETFKADSNRLVEIGNRPTSLNEVQGQFAGILKLTPRGWGTLSNVANRMDTNKLDSTKLLRAAIAQGVSIATQEVVGFWKEFDEPTDFLN